MKKLTNVLSAIDNANAHDPDTRERKPAAQLYGQRMSAELSRLFPDPSEPLQIAARGQHIGRWTLKRKNYPEGPDPSRAAIDKAPLKTLFAYHAWCDGVALRYAFILNPETLS